MAVRRVLPTSFKAGRPLRLEGVLYSLGQAIPAAVVARVRRANALLSNRWIIPSADPYRSRLPERTPRPVDISWAERVQISELP
jgi:hypothetical protein